MRDSKELFIGFVALAGLMALAGWLAVGCLDSPPTGPGGPRDYTVYFCQYDYDYNEAYLCFGYHVLSGKVDTLDLPVYPTGGMEVSADGQLLYIIRPDRVCVVDVHSMEIERELPFEGVREITCSEDSKYLAIMGPEVYVLRKCDYSFIHCDSLRIYSGRFLRNGNFFYGIYSYDTYSKIYKLNLGNLDTSTKAIALNDVPRRLGDVIEFTDEDKMYLYMRLGAERDLFAVYDIGQDSILYTELLIPGYGDLCSTYDGRYIFYTNPGWFIGQNPPPFAFNVFYVESNEKLMTVSATDSLGNSIDFPFGEMVVTPDDRWLVSITDYFYDQIVVFDIQNLKVSRIDSIDVGLYPAFRDLTCRKR